MCIQRTFEVQLVENHRIAQEIDMSISAVGGQTPDQSSEVVIAFASRAHETAAAIQSLMSSKHQFIDDAASLLRVLIEHVIEAGFLTSSSPQMVAKFIAYGDIQLCKYDKLRRKDFPELKSLSTPEEYDKARVDAVNQFPELNKAKSWHCDLGTRAEVQIYTMEIVIFFICTPCTDPYVQLYTEVVPR